MSENIDTRNRNGLRLYCVVQLHYIVLLYFISNQSTVSHCILAFSIYTNSPLRFVQTHWEQLGVQRFPQGHTDMWQGEQESNHWPRNWWMKVLPHSPEPRKEVKYLYLSLLFLYESVSQSASLCKKWTFGTSCVRGSNQGAWTLNGQTMNPDSLQISKLEGHGSKKYLFSAPDISINLLYRQWFTVKCSQLINTLSVMCFTSNKRSTHWMWHTEAWEWASLWKNNDFTLSCTVATKITVWCRAGGQT